MEESEIINALNLYCFDKIWNEPVSELRNNVAPYRLSDRSVKSSITLNSEVISLPDTTNSYFVYILSGTYAYALRSNDIEEDTWVTTEDILNNNNVLISTYTLKGRVLHKGYVYLRKRENSYILIINKDMTLGLTTFDELDDIRVTFYRDSDIANKITTKSFYVPASDTSAVIRNNIITYIQETSITYSGAHVTTYIDGYKTTISSTADIPADVYVDIEHDENSIFSFTVDLTDTNYDRTFFSSKDETYKQIVHIPKEYNSDNKVLTHNTMEIFVHKKDVTTGVMSEGLYVHRCADRSVYQITHNDISIPMFVLDAYRDHIGQQDIALSIVVRQHEKNNILLRDKNFIDLLYTQDDQTIIDCLAGRVDDRLYFWKADNLESSVYVTMMFDTPDFDNQSDIAYYVEGLGYYHTLSILYEKVVSSKIIDAYGGSITFNKPYIHSDRNIFPIVYLNGEKVYHKFVKYVNGNGTISIGFTSEVTPTIGDVISAELFLSGYTNTYEFTPTNDNTTIEVPYSDFVIYEVNTLNEYTRPKSIIKDYEYSYTEVNNTIGQLVIQASSNEGYYNIIFGSNLYDRTFVIQNKERVYYWYQDSSIIDTMMSSGKPLQFNLETCYLEGTIKHPVFYKPYVTAFLNKKRLIEGIDYYILERRDSSGNICGDEFILQNYEYLRDSNNNLEVYMTSASLDSNMKGFVVDNRASKNDSIPILFDTLSTIHVDGVLDTDSIYKGNYIETNIARQGAVFEIKTALPHSLMEFLNEYHTNDDLERLTILNEYFYGKNEEYPDTLVLENSHKLFSNYMTFVIYNVLNNPEFPTLVVDPISTKMLDQLSDYEYLLDIDLCRTNEDNLVFIDNYPTYGEVVVPDASTYSILQTITKLVLPEDKFTGVLDYNE